MKRRALSVLSVGLAGLCPLFVLGETPLAVVESARRVPVVGQADVVIVGGSSGAVAAAVAAADNGVSVFLAAPRPYLGDDICTTYRFWVEPGEALNSPLARALFERTTAPSSIVIPSVPFRYRADRPSQPPHVDPGTKLSNGAFGHSPTQSVQFNDDVTLTVDLGRQRALSKVHLAAYRRKGDFDVASVTVRVSADGETWRETATLQPREFVGEPDAVVVLSGDVASETQHLQLFVRLAEGCSRLLLGEISIEAMGAAEDKEVLRTPPTPMQVKQTLDQALVDAGVRFLFGSYPTDVLVDDQGRPAGVVLANRAGRQAVLAKVVVDATERAAVARMAGAEFAPWPAGPQSLRWVAVGGEARSGPDAAVRRLHPPIFIGRQGRRESATASRDVFEYTLSVEMKDGSAASLAEAGQVARDRTFHPGQHDASMRPFLVPPDPMKTRKTQAGRWPGAAEADMDWFRPAGIERLWALNGCAGVSREAAGQLLRPAALMKLGERIGRAAAEEAKRADEPKNARLAAPKALPPATVEGDILERLVGIRPTQRSLPTVPSAERSLPVLGTYDVVVVGGGTGGSPAAIGAARRGARTLVIEYQYGLGGVSTLGMIGRYWHGNRVGFTRQIDRGAADLGAAVGVIGKAEWYRREIRKAGGEIWFGAMGVGAVVRNGHVRGVVVATPKGRGVALARTVIDSTGNADIAAAAGAETFFIGAEHVAVQGAGLSPRNLGASYTNTDYTFFDDSDMLDLWRTMLMARIRYGRSFDLSPLPNTRERQRIVGDIILTPLDFILERTWPDTVCIARSNFDSHGYTVHPLFMLRSPTRAGLNCHLPFRTLLPKGLDGILATGLGVSAHRDAIPVIRMQPDVQNQGYAAGVAAAMAAEGNASVRQVDIRALQAHLVEVGNLPERILTDEDSLPLPSEQVAEAVARASDPGHRMVAVLLAHPQQSRPMLRTAYAAATCEEERLNYAHILGMMGDATGAATLAAAVEANEWDKGWNFRGMGQFGASMSRLDSLIIALGRTLDRRALGPIARKAAALDARAEFSHFRAIAVALETLADPAGAEPLARLLALPGITGRAVLPGPRAMDPRADNRNAALKEIVLARALYRCGDRHGLGERILRQYTGDVRGVFSRHAIAVLEADEQARSLH